MRERGALRFGASRSRDGPSRHPFDERPGPWAVMLGVDADGAESTVDAGLALIAQLELVVVRHLDQCVTVDSTVRRLARLRESRSLLAEFPDLRERCDAIEVDPALLAALTVQLRRMASEVIPLHDAALAAVLARCRDGLDDVDSVARQVLSGARPARKRIRVVVRVPELISRGVGQSRPPRRALARTIRLDGGAGRRARGVAHPRRAARRR